MSKLWLCSLLILLSSCASFIPSNSQGQPTVTLQSDIQLSYSGRGTGAGIALMSTMGPLGIAVGVAIDEGIRKDIETAAVSAGFDIVNILESYFASASIDTVEVLEYGFKDFPGEVDLLAPYIVLRLGDNTARKFGLIEQLGQNQEKHLHSLSKLKTDGTSTIESFIFLINHINKQLAD